MGDVGIIKNAYLCISFFFLINIMNAQSEGEGYVIANSRNVVISGCSDSSGTGRPDVFQHNSFNVTID